MVTYNFTYVFSPSRTTYILNCAGFFANLSNADMATSKIFASLHWISKFFLYDSETILNNN